jgi:hypothetical protein
VPPERGHRCIDPGQLQLPDLRQGPPHRRGRGHRPDHRGQVAQALEVVDRLPTRSWVRTMSIRTWPRSYIGLNCARRIARDSPARSPVRSARSRNGSAPANPTRRSSSPMSSSPSAHEVACTEEVHPPYPVYDLREIAFWLVGCTSTPLFPRSRSACRQPVKNGGQRQYSGTSGRIENLPEQSWCLGFSR